MFGKRIEKNGDMYEQHLKLIKWASEYDKGSINIRSIAAHKHYENIFAIKPIIIDSKYQVQDNIKIIEKVIFGEKNGI